MLNRFYPLITLMIYVGSAGCQPDPESPTASTPPSQPHRLSQPADDIKVAEQSLKELAPVFRPRGRGTKIPAALTITFPDPMAPSERVEAGSDIELEPGGVGFLSWSSPQTLKIEPAAPFPPGQKVRLSLKALHTRLGLVRGTITHTFETPAFGLREVRVASVDSKAHAAELELTFTGPIEELQAVKNRLDLTLGSRPLEPNQLSLTLETPHHLRLRVQDKQLDKAPLNLSLAAGTKMKALPTAVAPEASFSVTIPANPTPSMRILSAHLEEGTQGWFLRFVCTDEASGPAERQFYDSHTRQMFKTSPRCVLSEDAVKSSVYISPSEPLNISATRGGFRLLGKLPRGPLEVSVMAGAKTIDGGTLSKTFSQTFDVRRRSPSLRFAVRGRYAPVDQLDHVPLRSLNVSDINVEVRRVRPENLIFWASKYNEETSPRTADLIRQEKQSLTWKLDKIEDHHLDLALLMGADPRGLFEIKVSDAGKSSAKAVLRVVASQLDLIAKRTPKAVHVWAIDKHTLVPRSGVRVKLVTASGLVISEALTGRNGDCVLDFAETKEGHLPPPVPFALVAETPNDLTYLAFNNVQTPTGGAQTYGVSSRKPDPYVAAAWSDRGVYRPGETLHALFTVWKNNSHLPPESLPVELSLRNPQRVEIFKTTLKTSPAGVVEFSHRFPELAKTGRYYLSASVGQRFLNGLVISVETYVPERMRVQAKAQKPYVHHGEAATFDVQARWLFGGSTQGQRADLSCDLTAQSPRFEAYPNYNFGLLRNPHDSRTQSLGTVTGTLNDKNSAELTCPLPDLRARALGAGKLTARIAVFEGESGRVTRSQASTWVYPSPVLIGLKTSQRRVETGRPFKIEGILVNPEGERLDQSGEVQIELFRAERETDWKFDETHQQWSYTEHFRLALENIGHAEASKGRFQTSLVPNTPAGTYRIRATLNDTVAELDVSGSGDSYGYQWYGNSDQNRTPDPSEPEAVPITLPPLLRPGQPATAKIQVPFPGRVLMTVETDQLLTTEWRDIASPTVVDLKLEVDAQTPNVYVTALALRDPHHASVDSFIPGRGFGVKSVAVEAKSLQLPVELSAPDHIRSRSTLELKLHVPNAPPGTEAYVAVVDQGILSLTRHGLPKPLESLFPRRALEVDTFDTTGWNLVLPAARPSNRTGGGALFPHRPRVTMPIEPIALWSGAQKLDQEGRATVRFKVPEYRGELRAMAVVFGPGQVGQAKKSIRVRDPVVIEPTLPRTLTAGDTAKFGLFLSNPSEEKKMVSIQVEMTEDDAPSTALDWTLDTQTSSLTPGQNKTLWGTLSARKASGAVRVRFKAQFEGEGERGETTATQTVKLRPRGPKERITQHLKGTQGPIDLLSTQPQWVEGTERTQVIVTWNPYADKAQNLENLIHYPFGCAEQTSSRMRALLVADRFLGSTHKSKPRLRKIQEGLERLLMMQSNTGGFGFWPNDYQVKPWLSAYILDLWLDLRAEAFSLPPAAIELGLSWAQSFVRAAPKHHATPYLHFVLAKAQRAERQLIEAALKAPPPEPDPKTKTQPHPGELREARFLLLAAKYLAGDRRIEDELRSYATDIESINPANVKSAADLYSERRRRSLELAVLVELFGTEAKWLRSAMEDLASRLDANVRYTTQELAWSLTALGRFIGPTGTELPELTLILDGEKTLKPDPGSDNHTTRWTVAKASQLTLNVGAHSGPSPHVVILSEGVRAGEPAWQLGGSGLSVQRALVDIRGEPIRNRQIKLGEQVYSLITLSKHKKGPLRNIALVDPIPAGFEVMNPRLQDIPLPPWMENNERWSTDHIEVLDDRIEAFGTLPDAKPKTFFTPLRAVTAGTHFHPPVSLEAMYDPSRWARSANQPVHIVP